MLVRMGEEEEQALVKRRAAVRKSMQGNKRRETKPELLVRQRLRAAGLTGYRLDWAKAPGRPDIAFPGRKIAIFVNGCYRDTKPELLVRQRLRAAGLTGYRLDWAKAPGRPDIAFPGRKIALFVNGCYWPRCPHCNPSMPSKTVEFWEATVRRTVERDARALAESGAPCILECFKPRNSATHRAWWTARTRGARRPHASTSLSRPSSWTLHPTCSRS